MYVCDCEYNLKRKKKRKLKSRKGEKREGELTRINREWIKRCVTVTLKVSNGPILDQK